MSDLLGKSPAKRARPNYVYSIGSVSMVLFLLGFFGLVILQAQQFVGLLKERVNILIEIKPDTDSVQISNVLDTIRSVPFVKEGTTRFISKEEAISYLQEDFGDEFLALDLPNPLYDVITFNLQARYVESDRLSQVKNNFNKKDYVNDVYYQEGLVQVVASNLKKIGWFALALSILFLIVAVTLIHNTIRLALYANRFLIKNMELVGASWGFISRPHIIKSIWHGLLSAILAIAGLVFVLLLAQSQVEDLKQINDIRQNLFLFSGLLVLGVMITCGSTWYVINKYLRMRLEDLY